MKEIWISAFAVIVLFYVFLILPQQLQNRRRRKELARLAIGDEVATIGGLIGQISGLEGDRIALEVAPSVTVRVLRSAISHRLGAAKPGSEGHHA